MGEESDGNDEGIAWEVTDGPVMRREPRYTETHTHTHTHCQNEKKNEHHCLHSCDDPGWRSRPVRAPAISHLLASAAATGGKVLTLKQHIGVMVLAGGG